MRKLIVLALFISSLLPVTDLKAQPKEQRVKVIVGPDHADWVYKTGEVPKFSIAVQRDGTTLKNVVIKYKIGPEQMDPVKTDSLSLPAGTTTISAGTMKNPGFLRCTVTAIVDGNQYENSATAGFEPLAIKPVAEIPTDFSAFWNTAKDELAKVPMDAVVTLLPDRCTANVNVYQVSLQNERVGSRIYGILCVPKKEGKYPALLRVPGAGVRPYFGNISMAEKGMITLEIGIHGVPVTMEQNVYNNLGAGALRGYQNFNLDDRNQFYYKRVYLGCVRANDFLVSLPQFDGNNLAVTGGSQGGALSIVTASLDERVKYLAAYYPALCDLTGELFGRAGGWPHYFSKNNMAFNNKKDKIATCGYYDVVNFARNLKVPGIYSWGYNDNVCPPTSMYAAYNTISAPKSLFLALETAHWNYPEQNEKLNNWLLDKLNVKQ